jgi:hypothetical protein
LPFTLCLDVTLRVAAVPTTARAAVRLQDELAELAEDPRRWPFRTFSAGVEDGDLVVRARLLEPIDDLYDADLVDLQGELVATDLVLELLNKHCAAWRALEVGDRPLRAETRRVRRRFWTRGEADVAR